MQKNHYNVIGVMSGTSLDGIDLAYISFSQNKTWEFKILYSETISYSEKWTKKLRTLVSFKYEDLLVLDEDYTKYLSKVINQFIKNHQISNIDAVCSHGHTALHQPEKKLTYQIGNLPKIASLLHQNVVCDFRVQDVALGGQGAPLVPIGDELLFSEYEFCLNLGGFANISTKTEHERIAHDICPVNIVLNQYVNKLGLDFDDKGRLASKGNVSKALLRQLDALEFYKQSHPKSLGLEWVNTTIFPLIDSFQLDIKDILRTFIEHIAIQVSSVINSKSNASVLVTGGGTFNTFLLQRIEKMSSNVIVTPSKAIINYKEALIFGLLGVLKLRNETNCLASVTGAQKNHSSGKIYTFNN